MENKIKKQKIAKYTYTHTFISSKQNQKTVGQGFGVTTQGVVYLWKYKWHQQKTNGDDVEINFREHTVYVSMLY